MEAELSRLLAEGFLTARQARAVNRQWIGDFFRTELGQRLQRGQDVLREFKFSILADGRILQEDLTGEKLLLQGVVDCCFMEEDGDHRSGLQNGPGSDLGARRPRPPAMAGQIQTYGRR